MSEFRSKLDVELVDQQAAQGRGAWVVTAPFKYFSSKVYKEITVPTGFKTDFASVPRIPVIFALVGDIATEAAVIHDYLYETQTYSRKVSDEVFREAALACGVKPWQAFILYSGVRIGGWVVWDKKKKKTQR